MKNAVLPSHVSTAGSLDTSQAEEMTVDPEGMGVIMGLLSNLYSNSNEAVVREYACNARDSHVEAGIKRPIEVRLPTMLNPQFQVEDWGLGLSREELFKVYARYGTSTKRNSNDQIGAFGIGAKSGFAVGNQWTVTAVKDGEKTIVMFAKRRDGMPTIQELFHGPTKDPNGVLVDVGVENVDAVCAAAEKIFSCWKSGTVLVDGERPNTIWATTEKLAEEVYVDWESGASKYDSSSHFKLIMGGVPYNIPSALWNELSPYAQQFYNNARNTSITYVLDVPIGRVDITPNREELHITPRTRATVGRLVELAANSLDAWITQKIDSADTIWEAAKAYVQICKRLNYPTEPEGVYWKSQSLGKETVAFDRQTFTLDRKSYMGGGAASDYRTLSGDSWYTTIKAGASLGDVLFVTNVPDEKINTVRTYAKLVLRDLGKTQIVTLDGPGLRKGWFSVGEGADHDEIDYLDFQAYWTKGKSLRKANSAPGGSKNKTQYSTYMHGDTRRVKRTVNDIADMDAKVVAFGRGVHFSPGSALFEEAIKSHDAILVSLLGQQSTQVFQRSFPNATDANFLIKDFADKIVKNLSKEDVAILKANALQGSNYRDAMQFVANHRAKITNQDVLDYVDAFTAKTAISDADKVRLNYLQEAYQYARISNPHEAGATEDFFGKHLPLMLVTLRSTWYAQQVLGTDKAVSAALIDYINQTPVRVV